MSEGQQRDTLNQKNKVQSRLVKGLLIIAGTFFLGLGIIGIIIPILPTTPLLLLAAACYAKSSERFYYWLMNNRWFGNYIRNYREGKGIPTKIKILSISFLWITILFAAFFIVDILIIRMILIIIAVAVTIHILTIRTLKR
jgi:uncharacterized membrane protein YbaN (DUF454 family)